MKLLVMSSYLLDMVQSCDPCDPLPSVPSGQKYNVRSTGFRKIVDDWIDPATRSGIESTYGPIANWDTSRVTSMNYLFNGKTTFNEDISKWDVSKVTDMEASTFSIHVISFHNDLSLKLSLLPFPRLLLFLLQNFLTRSTSPLCFSLFTFFDSAAFNGAEAFNSDISKWEVSKVTKMANSTFSIHLFLFTTTSLSPPLFPFSLLFFLL